MEKETKTKEMINAEVEQFKNSLTQVLTGLMPGAYGLGLPFSSTQVSQVDTFFKNNRWYLISNMRQVLSEIYVEHGIVQTLVDLPVDDGFRGGVKIKSEQLSEDELADLEKYVVRSGALKGLIQAIKYTRLFGGGGLIIMTKGDPSKPLKVEDLEQDSEVAFKPVDLWELYYGMFANNDQLDPGYIAKEPEYYNYYQYRIHKSRVIRLEGKQAPSLIRPKLRGWGASVLETVVRSYNQYLKSVNLAFEVLDEYKVDVYGIENFNNTLAVAGGSDKVVKRVQLSNMLKNYQHALIMDNKDKFDTKTLSFSGIGDIMREIRMQIAADLRMPLTKLFGISASGFNSGEDDIENYNAMIESEIRSKVVFDVLRLVEICSQIKFGTIPDDFEIEFKPLRILSAEQEEQVKNNKLQRITSCLSAGLISPKEAKQSINKENLLPIKIDETDELLTSTEDADGKTTDYGVPNIKMKVNEKTLWERIKSKWE